VRKGNAARRQQAEAIEVLSNQVEALRLALAATGGVVTAATGADAWKRRADDVWFGVSRNCH
jgi:hypothetical protein